MKGDSKNGMGKSERFQLSRTRIHGNVSDRYGVMRCLDVHMVRGGDMALVIGILVITLILWWPRKDGGE